MHTITITGIEPDLYEAFARHAEARVASPDPYGDLARAAPYRLGASGCEDAVVSAAKDLVLSAARDQLAAEGVLFPSARDVPAQLFARVGDQRHVVIREALQDLYEKGLVTYPDTESRYLPDDRWADVPEVLLCIAAGPLTLTAPQTDAIRALAGMCKGRAPLRPGFRADPGDHHAIAPVIRPRAWIDAALSELKQAYPLLPHEEVYFQVARAYVSALNNMIGLETKALAGLSQG